MTCPDFAAHMSLAGTDPASFTPSMIEAMRRHFRECLSCRVKTTTETLAIVQKMTHEERHLLLQKTAAIREKMAAAMARDEELRG